MTHFCFVVFSIIDCGSIIGGIIGGTIGGALILIIGFSVYRCCKFHKDKNKQSKSSILDMFIQNMNT